MFALVALVLGISAGAAFGWANEQPTETNNQGYQHDRDNHGKKGKHKGDRPKENVPPTVTTPETPQPPTPAAPAVPAAPVTPQGGPSQTPPEQPATPESGPTPGGGGQEESPPGSPVVAQTPTQPAAPLAPVAERKELAQTGLNPGLIALLGAMCLGGGAFFLRRALARG